LLIKERRKEMSRPTDHFRTEDKELAQVLSFIEEQFIIAKDDLPSSVLHNYFTRFDHNTLSEDGLMLAITYDSIEMTYEEIFELNKIKYIKTPSDEVIKDLLLKLPVNIIQCILP
jgi:hypothetical protein